MGNLFFHVIEPPGQMASNSPTSENPSIGIPIDGTPDLRTGPPVRLRDTSQGRREDIPPPDWIQEELVRYQVTGMRDVRPSNLMGTPHKIFDQERWPNLSDKRFEAMNQSMLLATALLEIGMPYLACWLPRIRRPLGKCSDKIYDYNIVYTPTDEMGEREIQEARTELEKISDSHQWAEDSTMLNTDHWLGVTASVFPRLVGNFTQNVITPDLAMDERCKAAGHVRRQTTIGIASKYIDTLLKSDKASEEHLCAAFHLAVTFVHEIGHLVFWQNLENVGGGRSGTHEPSVEDQPVLELGYAFTAWLFGGWHPDVILAGEKDVEVEEDSDEAYFGHGMCWYKQPHTKMRPKWEMAYSMPFAYIQKMMTQNTWDRLEGKLQTYEARSAIRAQTPFLYGKDARIARYQKTRQKDGCWKWIKAPKYFRQVSGEDEGDSGLHSDTPLIGFLDEDWKTGTSSDGNPTQIPHDTHYTLGLVNPPADITVTYAGVFDDVTKTVQPFAYPHKHGRDPSSEKSSGEPLKKQRKVFDYRDWPEGVLRSLCAEHDLSHFGDKNRLINRLEQFDAAEVERHVVNNGVEPEVTKQSPEEESQKTHSIVIKGHLWKKRVDRFKQAIESSSFGILVGLQHLRLGHQDGPVIENLQVRGTSTVLQDIGTSGWDNVLLYRIQGAQQQDPGPRQQLYNVPQYILQLGAPPPVRESALSGPNINRQERVRALRDEAEIIEQENRIRRWALAMVNLGEAEIEYTTYISLLDQIAQVLDQRHEQLVRGNRNSNEESNDTSNSSSDGSSNSINSSSDGSSKGGSVIDGNISSSSGSSSSGRSEGLQNQRSEISQQELARLIEAEWQLRGVGEEDGGNDDDLFGDADSDK